MRPDAMTIRLHLRRIRVLKVTCDLPEHLEVVVEDTRSVVSARCPREDRKCRKPTGGDESRNPLHCMGFLGLTESGKRAHFSQYANRLAYLYFLQELNGIPAQLVFVYFCGDREMEGPGSTREWKGAIHLLHTLLGIARLPSTVSEAFVDIDAIR